jgi:hypothetical protein
VVIDGAVRTASAYIALVAAGLALAGCGGGDGNAGNAQGGGTTGGTVSTGPSPDGASPSRAQRSDQVAIETAIRSYTAAIAGGRATTACRLLSTTGQRFLSETDTSYRASTNSLKSCERAARKAAALKVGQGTMRDLRHPAVANVNVVRDRATAFVLNASPPIQDGVELVKEGNQWKLSRPPGIP